MYGIPVHGMGILRPWLTTRLLWGFHFGVKAARKESD